MQLGCSEHTHAARESGRMYLKSSNLSNNIFSGFLCRFSIVMEMHALAG